MFLFRAVLATSIFVFAGNSHAQSARDATTCTRSADDSSDDGRSEIIACTRLLESKGLPAEKRASYYYHRALHHGSANSDEAISDFTKAIELNPNQAEYYAERADIYKEIEKYDKALIDYSDALRLQPKNTTWLLERSNTRQKKKDFSGARTDLDTALALKPNDKGILMQRFKLNRSANDYTLALADINQLIKLEFKKKSYYIKYRAKLHDKMGNFDQALQDYTELFWISPTPDTSEQRAKFLIRHNRHSEAIEDLTIAIDLSKEKDSSHYHLRAKSHIALGKISEALQDLTEAIKAASTLNPSLLYDRGKIHDLRGSRDLALQDYRRAIELTAESDEEKLARNGALDRYTALTRLLSAGADSSPKNDAPGRPSRKIALVIGNSNYERARLPNPTKDARLIASTLRQIGFDPVIEQFDLGLSAMVRALKEFGDMAEDADWAVVYFSGHGLEIKGTNFVVPIGAQIVRESHAQDEAVSLDRIVSRVDKSKRLGVVILDACRDNPFQVRSAKTELTRNFSRGLGPIVPESNSVLIAYAAKHGSFALDGEEDANSPYATALAKHMLTPGISITDMFIRVRQDVLQATAGRQEPHEYQKLVARIVLHE